MNPNCLHCVVMAWLWKYFVLPVSRTRYYYVVYMEGTKEVRWTLLCGKGQMVRGFWEEVMAQAKRGYVLLSWQEISKDDYAFYSWAITENDRKERLYGLSPTHKTEEAKTQSSVQSVQPPVVQ